MTFVFHVERDGWLLFAALSGSAILFVNLAHLDDGCTSLPRIVRLPVKLQSVFGLVGHAAAAGTKQDSPGPMSTGFPSTVNVKTPSTP